MQTYPYLKDGGTCVAACTACHPGLTVLSVLTPEQRAKVGKNVSHSICDKHGKEWMQSILGK